MFGVTLFNTKTNKNQDVLLNKLEEVIALVKK